MKSTKIKIALLILAFTLSGAMLRYGISWVSASAVFALMVALTLTINASKNNKIMLGLFAGGTISNLAYSEFGIHPVVTALVGCTTFALIVGADMFANEGKRKRRLLKNAEGKFESVKILFVEKEVFEQQIHSKQNLLKEAQKWTPELGLVIVGEPPSNFESLDTPGRPIEHQEAYIHTMQGLKILRAQSYPGNDLEEIVQWMQANTVKSSWAWVGYQDIPNPKNLAQAIRLTRTKGLDIAQMVKAQMNL